MPDLNLLVTLDVLLTEGSVASAARRLGLSPSAMSRALARLREVTGDPLLVRAGRALVPTPRAVELQQRVGALVQDATAVLRPMEQPDLGGLRRQVSIRTSDGFVEIFGAALLTRIARDAPGIRLRFVQKTDKESAPLRDGTIDLDTGVVGAEAAPEIVTQALFRDRLVGVVRSDHALAEGRMTTARYLAARHIHVSRRGADEGLVDQALPSTEGGRDIAVIVGGFATAVGLARDTELVATVPERYTTTLRSGMKTFALPFATPEIVVSMLWHPRHHADPVHRWLRSCVRDVCGSE